MEQGFGRGAEWEFEVVKVLGEGSFSKVVGARKRRKGSGKEGEMVAIKLIKKRMWQENERMKVSVVRELEVLKHIHHPSLISLSASFDTRHHNCLVLEYAEGGELLDFLLDHHKEMSAGLARRIFCELASVLGWMHSIFLVHRDIKLENVLLTARPFPLHEPLPDETLPPLPERFVKLTDFGLSRFIDPTNPMLQTRCGSEEYAAPELIMSKSYDGRQTDSWALGVVLYAILTGSLPFARRKGEGKKHLFRIAKGEFEWPSDPSSEGARLCSPEAKEVVNRLLVRDPSKRATVADLRFMDWMKGWGGPKRLTFRDAWMKRGSEEVDRAVRAEVPF
ncbi:Pkinase-domain-containing protein [Atractiella rhizophila]|nr:Pkinase-domain-containing protein [Atractiella rhizophila]